MADPNARDAKLIQYLNEAYGKEKELETALEAHIQMTTRAPYKKRLKEHLRETKRHAREVERRIKKLGGKAGANLPGPEAVAEAANIAQELANRGAALVKGQAHLVRGTGEAEKMLKNAKTEFFNEAEEIANYNAIETLATAVGDKETAQLAKAIRREEERMQKFLERLIPQLTKAVATEEIPAPLRRTSTTRRRASSSRRSTAARSSSSRSASSGSTAKRATAARAAAKRSPGSRGSGSSSRRSSGSRSGGSSRRSSS